MAGAEGTGVDGTCNIASWLPAVARQQPGKAAIVVPDGRGADGRARWRQLSFAELDAQSDRYARAMRRLGVVPGTRVVLLVPPSLELFTFVFAVFKLGAVLVMVDPGLPRQARDRCLRDAEAEVFVGVPLAHVLRLLHRDALRSVRVWVTAGRRKGWMGRTLDDLDPTGTGQPVLHASQASDPAAILFTSGSTGVPKGALYTHGVFDGQVRHLRRMFGFAVDEIDLPTFPLFALFDPALGMTAVIPDMDARYPGKADPRKIVEAIEAWGCTNLFASPALIRNLAAHCERTGTKLPSLRRAICAGAPVPPSVLRAMRPAMREGAQVFTPYGATEALPVALVGSEELLGGAAAETEAGGGICVGRPVDGVCVRIIRIDDGPIPDWDDGLLVGAGEVGEITVRADIVTESYWRRDDQTQIAKIRERLADGQTAVLHRMGDVGRFDASGRLWMCGRKSHRVETAAGPMFTERVEKVFETHPAVRRAALVGVGERPRQRAVLLVERWRGEGGAEERRPWKEIEAELRELADGNGITRGVERIVEYAKAFPVDVRHNAKIVREELRGWVEGRWGGLASSGAAEPGGGRAGPKGAPEG
jgi:acyl-CoA synthetase (AMP-forming)/AMP-acid ligase II